MPRKDYEAAYRTVVEEKSQVQLPVTDEQKNAADIASIEFEVAKLAPALAGATAAVEGDVKALLKVVDGKWKHFGDLPATAKVNYVIETKAADDKRTYALAHEYAPALERGEKGWQAEKPSVEATVEALLSSIEKGDTVIIEREMAQDLLSPERKDLMVSGSERIQVRSANGRPDQTLAVPGITEAQIDAINKKMSKLNKAEEPEKPEKSAEENAPKIDHEPVAMGVLRSVAEMISKALGTAATKSDRVEPTFNEPAPPSAEAIAAAKAATGAALARMKANGVIT
jgi:hypothetical protein